MLGAVWWAVAKVHSCEAVRHNQNNDAELGTEGSSSYEKHVQSSVDAALIGEWSTDYHCLMPGCSNVQISSYSGPEFLRGEDADPSISHYEASSAKFQGAEGAQSKRMLTITQALPFHGQPGVLANMIQRFDYLSVIRHTGQLSLAVRSEGGMDWVIEWNHSRKWWRRAGTGEETGHAIAAAGGAHGLNVAKSLLNKWSEECESDADVLRDGLVGGSSLWFTFQAGVSAGSFYFGPWVSIDFTACLDPFFVGHHYSRLQCVQRHMTKYATSKTKPGSEETNAIIAALAKVSDTLDALIRPAVGEHCVPGVCIYLSLLLVPFPPFVWPVPSLGFGLNLPLAREDIRECGKLANVSEVFDEAGKSMDANAASHDATEAMARQATISSELVYSQGPQFNIFPVPATGWWMAADIDVVYNTRKIVKSVRYLDWHNWQSKRGVSNEEACARDRRDYFRNVGEFASKFHDFSVDPSTECEDLREKLVNENLDIAFKGAPLDWVSRLQPLASGTWQGDKAKMHFGGGYVYYGSDGFMGGVYVDFLAPAKPDVYTHSCKRFADFVNLYHTRVAPSQTDVLFNPNCNLVAAALPYMRRNDCGTVQHSADMYPNITVSRTGQILETTTAGLSQCEHCLTTRSFGSSCNFCPPRFPRLSFLGGATCAQFFEATAGSSGTCLEAWPLDEFDAQPVEQEAWQQAATWSCALAGGEVFLQDEDDPDGSDDDPWDRAANSTVLRNRHKLHRDEAKRLRNQPILQEKASIARQREANAHTVQPTMMISDTAAAATVSPLHLTDGRPPHLHYSAWEELPFA